MKRYKWRSEIQRLMLIAMGIIFAALVAVEAVYLAIYRTTIAENTNLLNEAQANKIYNDLNDMWYQMNLLSATISRCDAMEEYLYSENGLAQAMELRRFVVYLVQTAGNYIDSVIVTDLEGDALFAYPINAMGISKAMMERVIYANARVAAERGGTVIACTRYGNVMCSRGSVIPLFIDQIKSGNPITITDPDMTRFLMNLDEAVDLVMFAFQHANPGDLFIQKADASTIGDLAKAVQKLFGDTGTHIIGTRHGEKLYETLMTREERLRSEDMGNYYRVAADNRDLNYSALPSG